MFPWRCRPPMKNRAKPFLFEPSGKDIVIKPHIYLSEVIEFLKSWHPRTGSLADWREDDISCQVIKHVTDT